MEFVAATSGLICNSNKYIAFKDDMISKLQKNE